MVEIDQAIEQWRTFYARLESGLHCLQLCITLDAKSGSYTKDVPVEVRTACPIGKSDQSRAVRVSFAIPAAYLQGL